MKMLDLFSGSGGASEAMIDRGWDVVRVDIEEKFRPDLVADVQVLALRGYRPDLIWGSPPCREFSKSWLPWFEDFEPDMKLVKAFHKIVEELAPKFWILENVQGAVQYLGRPQYKSGPVKLWGVFPPLNCGVKGWKVRLNSRREGDRARLPYNLSKAVAVACEGTLF